MSKWKLVRIESPQGGEPVWAIRRRKWGIFGYEYLDLRNPEFTWTRRSMNFPDCLATDPELVEQVYQKRGLGKAVSLTLDQLKKDIFRFRLRGGRDDSDN